MRYPLLLLFLIFFVAPLLANTRSPRTANYHIQVELDTAEKKIYGKQVLTWKNPSADTVRELQYHLYLNAFKNSETTFMAKRDFPALLANSLLEECGWSWVDVQNIVDEHGNNLTQSMRYIQPNDDNEQDQTVLSVSLPQPVMPYDSIEVSLEWVTKIPKTMVRTGYNKDYYFMAQWYPKVGVYEPAGMRYATKGQWNCHQYHSDGEYYGEFGNYLVDITVPDGFVVGASGTLIKETTLDGKKTHSFKVNDVIDYTWTASPHYIAIDDEWKGIKIRLLVYPAHLHFKDRFITAIKNAMEYMEERFEKYPYPGLTIVDPPFHGLFTAAMEYPTLITTMSNCLLPTTILTPEILISHEFVHQYFQQMVATHEQEEPWMDEGMTNYYEGRIMDHYYGEHTSTIDFMGIKFGNIESNRADFFGMDNPKIAENSRYSWQFTEGGYHSISYNKTAVWLRTLEGLVGIETMDEIMKTYFLRWKFKHPCGEDFIEVVNEVVTKNHGTKFGEDMNWFFEQVLYGTVECDYKLASITNTSVRAAMGIFDNLDDCITQEEAEQNQGEEIFRSSVIIHRLGELTIPVDLLVQFDNGETVMETWNGLERTKRFEYTGPQKVVAAHIDPEEKIYIDKNFINNSLTLSPSKKGIRSTVSKFLVWIQNAMQSLNLLV
jgi:hypothetical protein